MTDQHDQTTKIAEPEDVRGEIQQARALIPVGPSGATPMNFAQQVDFAKTMAMARASLPAHLQGSPGDCLAIIDIASRANLSPYMVANMTYVDPKSGRLGFMSQLYHAFLIQSKMIIGDFDVVYAGDGDDMTCTVSAKLRSDGKLRSHTSPTLGNVRPPMNLEKGVRKGSPLWDKKPQVQLFYDTSRDWVRMHAPTATLGIFAPEEFEETPIGPAGARDVTPANGLKDRIAGDKAEGFRDGHAATELDKIANGAATLIEGNASPATVAAGTVSEPGLLKEGKVPETKPATPPPAGAGPSDAKDAKPADKTRGKTVKAIPATASECETAEEYTTYVKSWIDNWDGDMLRAQGRFDDEFDERKRLKVGVSVRASLQLYLGKHFAKDGNKRK